MHYALSFYYQSSVPVPSALVNSVPVFHVSIEISSKVIGVSVEGPTFH